MSCLHLLNKSPAHGMFAGLLKTIQAGDSLLLLEDAVYHLRRPGELALLPPDLPVYFLAQDLRARGLGEKLPAMASPVDYDGFVELCVRHDKTVSWF